ncbi:MAG: tetratricopeptide repeat protein [Desulfomonilaceae bacterium]|nr:tetratricopeptide repeat protein [Desulfomonilaceae bacterium]
MKWTIGESHTGRKLNDERGSAAYSFVGFMIVVVVIIAAIFVIPDLGRKTPDSALASARAAMAKQDWEKAVSLFDQAIKAQPGNIDAYIGRSAAYLNTGKLADALADADNAVKLDPDSAPAYGQKAIVEKVLGQDEAAIGTFTKALELDGNYAWAYAQRAHILSKLGDQEKALVDVNKALEASPNFADGFRVRAWVLTRMGKCKEASEDFSKVAQLKPNDAWSIQDRAWFLMTCPDEKLRDGTKALELARKAHEMTEGQDAVVQETLAEAYFQAGDAAKAAELQEKAIALKSKSCPQGSCADEMKIRLKKYTLAARNEERKSYEILPLDSTYRP